MANSESRSADWPARLPFYYGWVMVLLSSIAMTATLPGRTHGLGLITEDLLRDLSLERTDFSNINLGSSLIGALFCIPVGWWIDRYGVRIVFVPVVIGLALSVMLLGKVHSGRELFFTLILIRGFGQSALSVVSLAMIGKWFGRKAGMAMGVYAVLMGLGFGGSIAGMTKAIEVMGWRGAQFGLGGLLLAFAVFGWIFIRSTPESCGLSPDTSLHEEKVDEGVPGYTLWQALSMPTFWSFVLGTSAFNLVWSAMMLFNESILAEVGFDKKVAADMLILFGTTGLVVNLICGAVAKRERLGWLLGLGLVSLAAAMALFPRIHSLNELRYYSATTGIAGGIVTVVFFTVWGPVFGRAHVAFIQGAAQLISVAGSAIGPVLLARGHDASHSYFPAFRTLAIAMSVLALFAFLAPIPPEPVRDDDPLPVDGPELALQTVQE